MGNRHNLEVYTPHRIHHPKHPNVHFTVEEGKPEYTPNLEGIELQFGKGKIRRSGHNGYLVDEYTTDQGFRFPLAPKINQENPEEFWTDEQTKKVIKEHSKVILALMKGGETNVIIARHGRLWGLFPEQAIANLLREQGLEVPNVFPKVGGRNRVQEHAILILGRN